MRNNTTLFGRLKDILDDKERALNSQDLSVKAFEDSAWAYKQAWTVGQRKVLKELRELIDFAL